MARPMVLEPRQIVSASVPASMRDELERLAREADRSLSAELRRALVAYLSNRPKEK
jgi:hypothetical protein